MARKITAEGFERRARVVELRQQRWSYEQIGAELGVTAQRAHQLWRDGIARVPLAKIDEIRTEEIEFTDTAIRNLMRIARDPDTTARTRVEAWSAIRGWAERRAKLTGIDAPKQVAVEVTENDARDTELRAMIDAAKAEIEAEEQGAAG